MPVRAFEGGEGEVSAKAKDCANGCCNKAIEMRESELVLRMSCLFVNVVVWMLVGREMGLEFWGLRFGGWRGKREKERRMSMREWRIWCYSWLVKNGGDNVGLGSGFYSF